MITTTYIISQVFVIINYLFLIITYQIKNNKKILILNTIACTSSAIGLFLLHAYSGCAMSIIAVLRNFLFINENKNGHFDALLITFVLIALFTLYTYENLFSLLPVIATILYSIAVWQNDDRIYKLFGIPIEICWLSYHIYIFSIFGIILESILFISVLIGIKR